MTAEQIREVIREELDPIHAQLTVIDHSIRGNGSPGLKQRVSILEESRHIQSRLWMTLCGFLLGILGTVVTNLL